MPRKKKDRGRPPKAPHAGTDTGHAGECRAGDHDDTPAPEVEVS